MSAAPLEAVVVIPARNEAARIGECLAALGAQRGVATESFEVIVVLDACTDATAEAARTAGAAAGIRLELVEGPGSGSGAARALGMDLAYRRLAGCGALDGLIASTDADSRVAPDWLATQLTALRSGAEAIGGLVLLDGAEADALDPATVDARERRNANGGGRLAGETHTHFAGASIGVSAKAYATAGGMRPLRSLEDDDFAGRLSAAGTKVHHLDTVRVTTSARTDGRAERGLSADLALDEWFRSHSLDGGSFSLDEVLAAKDRTVSVVLPAREVASTLATVLDDIEPLRVAGLVDELLVVDAGSKDGTAAVARMRGVRVEDESALLPELGSCLGKGDAMLRGAAATEGDVVAFLDTDSIDGTAGFALGLLGAMFLGPSPRFVKGAFRRPLRIGDVSLEGQGGRVTELVARPLLNLLFPALAGVRQPLAGEAAIDRDLLERLSVPVGYGVEIAMLIDVWREAGLDAICQVDLGTRQNRHQDLAALGRMALEVMAAAHARAPGADPAAAPASKLVRALGADGLTHDAVRTAERPPLAELISESRARA